MCSIDLENCAKHNVPKYLTLNTIYKLLKICCQPTSGKHLDELINILIRSELSQWKEHHIVQTLKILFNKCWTFQNGLLDDRQQTSHQRTL